MNVNDMKEMILAHVENATPEQYADGLAWYGKAQGIAKDIADAYLCAAADLGLSGAQVQAVVWCVVRGSSE